MSLLNVSLLNGANNSICFTTYEVLKIVNNGAIIYTASDYRTCKQKEISDNLQTCQKATYTGEMNAQSKRRLKRIFCLWCDAVNHYNSKCQELNIRERKKFIFVSLTLCAPQVHTDEHIKQKLLHPFLRVMREKVGACHFIWKAEPQENGNIHFHLVFDQYIDKLFITETWTEQLKKEGYLQRFQSVHGARIPPSTHVEGVNNTEIAIKYFAKYLSKGSNTRTISGAIWKASKALYDLKSFCTEIDNQQRERIIELAESRIIDIIEGDRYLYLRPVGTVVRHILTDYNYERYKQIQAINCYILWSCNTYAFVPDQFFECNPPITFAGSVYDADPPHYTKQKIPDGPMQCSLDFGAFLDSKKFMY